MKLYVDETANTMPEAFGLSTKDLQEIITEFIKEVEAKDIEESDEYRVGKLLKIAVSHEDEIKRLFLVSYVTYLFFSEDENSK